MMDLSQVPLNEYGHVQTRDGRPVRLLCSNARCVRPVIGLVKDDNGNEDGMSWLIDGKDGIMRTTDADLVPVPRKVRVKGWLNVYRDHRGYHLHESRTEADEKASIVQSPRIACREIDIEVTEGEGLTWST